jgi:hypothetical protein
MLKMNLDDTKKCFQDETFQRISLELEKDRAEDDLMNLKQMRKIFLHSIERFLIVNCTI